MSKSEVSQEDTHAPPPLLSPSSGPTYHPTFRIRQPLIGMAEASTNHQHHLSQILHQWKFGFIIYPVQSRLHPADSTLHPPPTATIAIHFNINILLLVV